MVTVWKKLKVVVVLVSFSGLFTNFLFWSFLSGAPSRHSTLEEVDKLRTSSKLIDYSYHSNHMLLVCEQMLKQKGKKQTHFCDTTDVLVWMPVWWPRHRGLNSEMIEGTRFRKLEMKVPKSDASDAFPRNRF